MILVRKAEYVIKTRKPTSHGTSRGSRALSADDHEHHDHVREPRTTKQAEEGRYESQKDDHQNQKYRASNTGLKGLMAAMKLESQMILLRRELQLYQTFDDYSSGEFNP